MAYQVTAPRAGFTGTEKVADQPIQFEDGRATVEDITPSARRYMRRHGFTVVPVRDETGAPAGNATTETWREYASTKAETDEERAAIEGMGREELRDQYGPSTTDPTA